MQALAFEDAVLYLERALAITRLREQPAPAERAALQLALANACYSSHDEDRNPASRPSPPSTPPAKPAPRRRPTSGRRQSSFGGSARTVRTRTRATSRSSRTPWRSSAKSSSRPGSSSSMCSRSTRGHRSRKADHPAHAAYAAEAVALARATGDSRLLADALCAHAFVHSGPDFVTEFRRTVAEVAALEVTDVRGPILSWGGAVRRPYEVLRCATATSWRSVTVIEETRTASRRSANPDMRYYPLLWEALRLRLEGRWSEAEARAQDAVDSLTGFDESFALTNQFVQLVPIRGAQGRLDELEPLLAAFADANPSIPAYQCALANLHVRVGRIAEARDRLAAIVDGHLDAIDRHTDLWFVGDVTARGRLCHRRRRDASPRALRPHGRRDEHQHRRRLRRL